MYVFDTISMFNREHCGPIDYFYFLLLDSIHNNTIFVREKEAHKSG